jgi:glycosyltransferase involved in cell wall biosynthesis
MSTSVSSATASQPQVSVVIPAYNVARFVAEAIRSALAQRAVSLEVIVVDDGSTDRTRAVLEGFAANPRVSLIFQDNLGPSGSRNTALAAARGTYVGFLDADDLWEPSKAEKHVALMESAPGLDVSYSWWRTIDEASRETGRLNTVPPDRVRGGLTFRGLVIENFTGTASTLFCRRKALERVGGFEPSLRSNVDLDLLLRLAALRPNNIALVPEILTSYRKRADQITTDWSRMRTNLEVVLARATAAAPQEVERVRREAFARGARYHAYIAYERGDFRAARRLLAQAWAAHPVSLGRDKRAWLTTAAILASFLPSDAHRALADAAKSWRTRKVDS